ncbi:hypothetical protein K4I03_2140 [Streptococcus sanguinis]|nr:hypothetical protein [Streptococcus sanguinis]
MVPSEFFLAPTSSGATVRLPPFPSAMITFPPSVPIIWTPDSVVTGAVGETTARVTVVEAVLGTGGVAGSGTVGFAA